MGMWIASHSELLKWMQHEFWHKAQSLGAAVPDPLLDYPERTTGVCCCVRYCTHVPWLYMHTTETSQR